MFIGSHSHLFSAVKLSTGKAVWTVKLGDRIESSACVSACGNHVIVGKLLLGVLSILPLSYLKG